MRIVAIHERTVAIAAPMRNAAIRFDEMRNSAWQVAGYLALTDDVVTYSGLNPRKPFDPRSGQWGAVELVARYSEEQRRVRLALRPGMTGPMQVYGRGLLSLSERVAVERDYVENLSIGRDLRILAMTFPVVVGRRGAY